VFESLRARSARLTDPGSARILDTYVLNHIHLPDVTTLLALAELCHPGDAIRERRIELGWTQAELAKRCGIPQADISRIENGRLDARWSTIQRISVALANTNEPPRRSVANGGRVAKAPGPPPKKWSVRGTKIAITPAKK
jgi:DNA-binding XRE family transcriptional regulator